MYKALVLGAGLVARPLVQYLLADETISVTVASRTVEKADKLISNHPRGQALCLQADDLQSLENLIEGHDLAISLLPAPLHPVVADLCVKHQKHMVTTSYLSDAMRELDEPARKAEVMILNEIGVDPGIDHMSAMRVINDVRARGGRVVSFRSYCGGLPAPDANDNPWGYKFSWSPRAVCTAGKNAARFLEDGRQVDLPGPDLFTCHHPMFVEGVGELEAYPNRDSLGYIETYGLQGVDTMFRGTFRYPGWCRTLKAVVDLGLLDESPVNYPAGMTLAQWMATFGGAVSHGSATRESIAGRLGLEPEDDVLHRLDWLGLFSGDTIAITGRETTPLDILAARMLEKMPYGEGERDMIVLKHDFRATFPDGMEEHITSTMVDYGQPNGDSAMARTVSLPAAIAARGMLQGRLMTPGVHIPVRKEIYEPVLNELATLNITCKEETEKLAGA